MRFLVDECTGPGVATWLSQQGYEVFSVYDQVRGSADDALLLKAFSEGWILITNTTKISMRWSIESVAATRE